MTVTEGASSRWDVFIAYPSGSWREASALFDALSPDLRVFFDRKSLPPGDGFDLAIPDAMRSSRMTAVLVDTGFSMAHYARAESIFAIALAQADPGRHRVVPVYIQGRPKILDTPYQFLPTQSLDLATEGTWDAVALKLRFALNSNEIATQCMGTPAQAASLDAMVSNIRGLPIGPRFQIFLVRPALIEAYADAAGADKAPEVLGEAIFLQMSANPSATYIRPSHLPDPRFNPPSVYWRSAFSEACLHGPRMVAALLYAMDDSGFTDAVKAERATLLSTLAHWNG